MDPVQDRLDADFGPEFAPYAGRGGDFDLQPLRAALARLGDPHARLPPTFHVAGTNGKGSTCAFLAAICEAAGLRAHAFTKPHLLYTRERVRLANAPVTDELFLAAIDRVAALAMPLRHFEAQLAAAFLMFAETPADALILETGMGGTLDATNVIARPAAAIITPVDIDHTAALGATLAEIAAHKAGIVKPGAPVIVARQKPDALNVIEHRAEALDAPTYSLGLEWDAFAANGRMVFQTADALLDLPLPALLGRHQIENAGAAIMALRAPGHALSGDPRITDDAIAAGVQSAFLPARLQRLRDETWLDGAHNPAGAHALAAALKELDARAPRPTILIVGILARKDAPGILAALRDAAGDLIAIPIRNEQHVAQSDLAHIAASLGYAARTASSLQEAIAQAHGARIVICGSLALAAEALQLQP
ncbi:MAG: bifunctional folylpolyglutamate synthase/dihydrofolate synthase [Hyphomonadaceae bacterium]|nr:bifunctional folylpolyglutamate synthase/dihydrofolate synthase [Hyphomonadaceae bacterium]